jgi:ubiquinone/menaquinone biosynthesis C-methylase UbiE
MKIATRQPAGTERAQSAWSAFWQDPGQSRCAAGAPQIWHPLTRHWASFATSLPSRTRVLDLGCGAGAVAHMLLAARDDLQITGVDFARLPLVLQPRVELLSETEMEALPFAERSFGAVVSQFGFEYSLTSASVREIARVASPGAGLSFIVHHSGSDIVATNRVRIDVLEMLLDATTRTSFCAGERAAFLARMSMLVTRCPHDALAVELAQSLPSRLDRSPRERIAIWKAIEDALAPERCLAEALDGCCLAESRIDEWLAPLRTVCELQAADVLREAAGRPIAWKVSGRVRDP